MEAKKLIRLQKYLTQCGILTRRNAEECIKLGEVIVNGHIASIGVKIDPNKDHIRINGKKIQKLNNQKNKIVLAMNKPKGILCSHKDPYHLKTIFNFLPNNRQYQRLLIAGRLDKESEGLLILTNDGELSNNIAHPSKKIKKKYQITLDRPFEKRHLNNILKGVIHNKELLRATKVAIPRKQYNKKNYKLEIHLEQGRKREIRRIFKVLGYHINKLKRFQIGGYKLNKIAAGCFMSLNQDDIKLINKK